MENTTNDTINRQIIADILQREGGSVATNDSIDRGGRTQFGISERAHPQAWVDNKVTLEEAVDIYRRRYLEAPGFGKIEDPRLRAQLTDFGVLSGPACAIQKLQLILKQEADGVLGPKSLAAANSADPIILSNKLALERVKMIGRIVNKNPSQSRFLNGWLERALSFCRF